MVNCANRVLRQYLSTKNLTNELKTLENYIIKTYAPVWFDIKRHHTAKEDPKDIRKVIQTTRNLPENIKKLIDPVIQKNGFFRHPEIVDDRKQIRELGYRKILKARSQQQEGGVRIFKLPSINFEAKDYTELVDWTQCKMTPPPH